MAHVGVGIDAFHQSFVVADEGGGDLLLFEVSVRGNYGRATAKGTPP